MCVRRQHKQTTTQALAMKIQFELSDADDAPSEETKKFTNTQTHAHRQTHGHTHRDRDTLKQSVAAEPTQRRRERESAHTLWLSVVRSLTTRLSE